MNSECKELTRQCICRVMLLIHLKLLLVIIQYNFGVSKIPSIKSEAHCCHLAARFMPNLAHLLSKYLLFYTLNLLYSRLRDLSDLSAKQCFSFYIIVITFRQ